MTKQKFTDEQIIELLKTAKLENLSSIETAAKFGTTTSSVSAWAKRIGMKLKRNVSKYHDWDKIKRALGL